MTPADDGTRLGRARSAAGAVTDPELPMLTLDDLGILRDVRAEGGRVVVTVTPTYSGCPAMDTIHDDLVHALAAVGVPDAEVRMALSPPWSSDRISPEGRRKLQAAGIAPPGPAPRRGPGPVPLRLERRPDPPGAGMDSALVRCPRCGSPQTVEISRFSSTACRALRRCESCQEPFDQVKEV